MGDFPLVLTDPDFLHGPARSLPGARSEDSRGDLAFPAEPEGQGVRERRGGEGRGRGGGRGRSAEKKEEETEIIGCRPTAVRVGIEKSSSKN